MSPEAEGGHRAVDAALATLDLAARFVIIGMMAGMVAVVSGQVFARYVLSSSLGWADEIGRLTFVWCIFLAIPLGVRAGAHIGIELISGRLHAGARDRLARLMALLAAALMILVAYESIKIAVEQWDELMASLNMSAAWFIVPVAAGAVHTALHLLRVTVFGPYESQGTVVE